MAYLIAAVTLAQARPVRGAAVSRSTAHESWPPPSASTGGAVPHTRASAVVASDHRTHWSHGRSAARER